jgi:hypothetical protein
MRRMLNLPLAFIAVLALAAPAFAQAPNPPLNGAYYGVYPPTNTAVAMAIRNNVIGPTSVFSMGFNGDISTSGASPSQFLPGTFAVTLANPGGVRINAQGNWNIPAVAAEQFFAPPLCGQSRSNYLVAGMACTEGASGLNPGAVPLFSLRKATLSFPSGSQFSGSVNATPRNPNQASNPATPWTGPEGSITLTVSGSGANASVTGSGSLTPINPQTGIPTGAAPITVLYGPAPVTSSPTSDAGGTGGLSTSTGFFSLPSSPPGYTACGAILPTGFAFGNIGCGGTLPYVPATFFLAGVSTG